jgi:hypothetical protein
MAPVLDADDAGHPLPSPALLGLGRAARPPRRPDPSSMMRTRTGGSG